MRGIEVFCENQDSKSCNFRRNHVVYKTMLRSKSRNLATRKYFNQSCIESKIPLVGNGDMYIKKM